MLTLAILAVMYSCNPTELPAKNSRASLIDNRDGALNGKAFIYPDNPTVLAGPNYGPDQVRMSDFLDPMPRLITMNSSLTGDCSQMFFSFPVTIEDCILSLSKESRPAQPLTRKSDGTFIFPADSPEFYQVNTLYHINLVKDRFFKMMSLAYQETQKMDSLEIPKSIPYYLMNSKLFWFKAMSSIDRRIFNHDYLVSYAQCELEGNASFSPAGPTLCFGGVKDFPKFSFVQDPSVIYHEMGHALISIMMNLRNGTGPSSYHPFRSNLGSYGYSEAGAIGEGLSDYFSFIMNGRERFGEFALGKIYNQARPLSERDRLHKIPGLSETSSGRLSYPHFLLYDPNNPKDLFESVHYAGQIVSHYLVALTKSLKNSCSTTGMTKSQAHEKVTSWIMLLIAETLSELGDLNARGIDNFNFPLSGSYYFNNLDPTHSYLWTQYNNPINFRRFFQVFGKNINKYISAFNPPHVGLCPSFDSNKSEKLLDDYGLLLFKTYNDNGTSTKDINITYQDSVIQYSSVLTPVNESNRRKSVLISKELIELAERSNEHPNRASAFIIDNSSDIQAILKELLYKGLTVPISSNVAGTEYNNGNIQISPGEILGLIPNLFNKSNTTMAGVQILATDWDHVDIFNTSTGDYRPCVLDAKTTQDQGGETQNTCDDPTLTNFKRLIKNQNTNNFPSEAVAPACLVLLEDKQNNQARWVSQNEFRKKQNLALMEKDCLGYSTSQAIDEDFSFNPHECLVRFLPGGQDAMFSKISPQKTYYESVIQESKEGSFNLGNVLLMEVNKWVPPGTKFRCRLRARFSNCSDCYANSTSNNDDFIDAEFNGHRPFKIINFDFEVND